MPQFNFNEQNNELMRKAYNLAKNSFDIDHFPGGAVLEVNGKFIGGFGDSSTTRDYHESHAEYLVLNTY